MMASQTNLSEGVKMYNASENLNISSSEPKAKIGQVFNVIFEVLCPTCGGAVANPYSEAHHWSTYDLEEIYDLGPGDTVRIDCDHLAPGQELIAEDSHVVASRTTVRVKIPGRFTL